MLIDWLLYGLLIWGLVAVLNATAFKKQPASRPIAWLLTIGMFFVNLFALTVLQIIRYKVISQDLGLDIKPRSPADFFGALMASSFFYSLLRKQPKNVKTTNGMGHSPSMAPTDVSTQAITTRTTKSDTNKIVTNAIESGSEELWAQALTELEGGNRRPGLWAKAFAETQGNESAAKANYLRDRVRQLSEENRRRVMEPTQCEPTVAHPRPKRISYAAGAISTITAALVVLSVIILVGMIGWALFV